MVVQPGCDFVEPPVECEAQPKHLTPLGATTKPGRPSSTMTCLSHEELWLLRASFEDVEQQTAHQATGAAPKTTYCLMKAKRSCQKVLVSLKCCSVCLGIPSVAGQRTVSPWLLLRSWTFLTCALQIKLLDGFSQMLKAQFHPFVPTQVSKAV